MSTDQGTFDVPEGQTDGVKLVTRTECRLDDVDEEWGISDLACGDEVEDAIEAVRDDHSEEFVIETDSVWFLKVQWNENTDSVWVGRYGYNGGMEVVEE